MVPTWKGKRFPELSRAQDRALPGPDRKLSWDLNSMCVLWIRLGPTSPDLRLWKCSRLRQTVRKIRSKTTNLEFSETWLTIYYKIFQVKEMRGIFTSLKSGDWLTLVCNIPVLFIHEYIPRSQPLPILPEILRSGRKGLVFSNKLIIYIWKAI